MHQSSVGCTDCVLTRRSHNLFCNYQLLPWILVMPVVHILHAENLYIDTAGLHTLQVVSVPDHPKYTSWTETSFCTASSVDCSSTYPFVDQPFRYDVPSAIPDASIQRAGENVQAIVREVSTSPLLEDPKEDRHGKLVFFDLFGKTVIMYPERVAAILNTLVAIAAVLNVYFGTSRDHTRRTNQGS